MGSEDLIESSITLGQGGQQERNALFQGFLGIYHLQLQRFFQDFLRYLPATIKSVRDSNSRMAKLYTAMPDNDRHLPACIVCNNFQLPSNF